MPEKTFALAERRPPTRRQPQPAPNARQTEASTPQFGFSRMQSAIGNRAMGQMMVARQVADAPAVDAPAADAPTPAENPLTPAQVKSAIAYYTAQPWLYTKKIIKQIQSAVGTEPTGKMTAEDVQAVARRQQELNIDAEPALKVDGKAGPRTLPSIFTFGLRQEDEISSYTDTAREKWENRGEKTDEEIAAELAEETNKRLEKADVPPLEFQILDRQVGRGAFFSQEWQLILNESQFKDPKLRDPQALTATVYHEGRHAEQAFSVARMLAGRGMSAKAISASLGMKLDVAKKAREKPFAPNTMEAVIAQGWYDSMFSEAGLEKIGKNNDAIDKAFKVRKEAREAFEKDPSPENEKKKLEAEAAYDKVVAEHDEFPHEHDAERVEDRIKRGLGEIP